MRRRKAGREDEEEGEEQDGVQDTDKHNGKVQEREKEETKEICYLSSPLNKIWYQARTKYFWQGR